MARVFYYVTMVSAIFLMFALIGLPGSSTSQLLNAVNADSPENYKTAGFWDALFGTAGKIALFSSAATVIVGLLLRQSFTETAIALFVGTLGGWIVGDMVSVITTMKTQFAGAGSEFVFIYNIVWFFFIIFIIGAILSMISWWRNSET